VPVALSTGHEVGLGITALAFIAFALASSFLFPRVRPDYPGRGLLAFVVIAFVFFFGMLTAVEVFGAESKSGEAAAPEATISEQTTTAATSTEKQTTSVVIVTSQTTTTTAKPAETKVPVSETEFKITLSSTELKAGELAFEVKDDGKIPHDLAIKGTSDKTKEIAPGSSAELKVTLKPGTYVLYCSIPGHEQAGMKQSITVS
jgi:uncharacterized cupredoxin-like copper-binding protein